MRSEMRMEMNDARDTRTAHPGRTRQRVRVAGLTARTVALGLLAGAALVAAGYAADFIASALFAALGFA